MMDEKQFEQKYREWKNQAAPQLWERIEGGLAEHPEREGKAEEESFFLRRYLVCAAAAAVLILAVTVSGLYQNSAFDRKEESSVIAAMETTAAFPSAERKTNSLSQLLMVPENAVTVSEDSRYFSEEVLKDTELLCEGEVEDISFEYDKNGRAVKVAYQINLEEVYYAQDYISKGNSMVVKSPIVETQGEEVLVLYQLQQDCTYLLPLCKKEGSWELVYPFAPQVQVTEDRAYLFHTGYISLMNGKTSTVMKDQEGLNDYFYDRMLLREDEEFLSEFIQLVERKVKTNI